VPGRPRLPSVKKADGAANATLPWLSSKPSVAPPSLRGPSHRRSALPCPLAHEWSCDETCAPVLHWSRWVLLRTMPPSLTARRRTCSVLIAAVVCSTRRLCLCQCRCRILHREYHCLLFIDWPGPTLAPSSAEIRRRTHTVLPTAPRVCCLPRLSLPFSESHSPHNSPIRREDRNIGPVVACRVLRVEGCSVSGSGFRVRACEAPPARGPDKAVAEPAQAVRATCEGRWTAVLRNCLRVLTETFRGSPRAP
jgi:hypothetical protein